MLSQDIDQDSKCRGELWKLPCVVDALTEDFIRERNPTDLNDLLRWVPGIETGGTSLLVRQPGLFSIRGMGGTEPAFDERYFDTSRHYYECFVGEPRTFDIGIRGSF